jgi:hypothetical protein
VFGDRLVFGDGLLYFRTYPENMAIWKRNLSKFSEFEPLFPFKILCLG